ncbi:hypothetical protein D9758_017582 [Tetrapyrgos nigripes]|uniref:DNA helicase n=1 Tax=Tetrapyrgos nigripes TaxID=182062 RepID=A0A8H5CDU2_9AGAR|nr:hypothetical protein D9758_017582 [Tetrapyrgos nigripes]
MSDAPSQHSSGVFQAGHLRQTVGSPIPTPKNRGGDIHSSLVLTPRSRRQTPRTPRTPYTGADALASDADAFASDGALLDIHASSTAPGLGDDADGNGGPPSVAVALTDEPDELCAIWGTMQSPAPTPTPKKAKNPYMRSTCVSSRVDPVVDTVLKEFMLEIAERDTEESRDGMEGQVAYEEIGEMMGKVYKVRSFGVRDVNMRELNPSDTEKLVSSLTSSSAPRPLSIPDMKVALFPCLVCSHTVHVEIERGKIAEPGRCPRDVCASGRAWNWCIIDAPLLTAKSGVYKHSAL